jgi:hypothetical protein
VVWDGTSSELLLMSNVVARFDTDSFQMARVTIVIPSVVLSDDGRRRICVKERFVIHKGILGCGLQTLGLHAQRIHHAQGCVANLVCRP